MIIKTIWEIKDFIQSKKTNQIISFEVINMIWKKENVDVIINYAKDKKDWKLYYKAQFKNNPRTVSYAFRTTKEEIISFIIDEAKRLWFKDTKKVINKIKNINNFDFEYKDKLEEKDLEIIFKYIYELCTQENDPYIENVEEQIDYILELIQKHENKDFSVHKDNIVKIINDNYYFNSDFNEYSPKWIQPQSGFDQWDMLRLGYWIESSLNNIFKTELKLMKRCEHCWSKIDYDSYFKEKVCSMKSCRQTNNN